MADSRYTAAEKFPAHIGKDPSEETLKALFSQFGNVWLCQITNNSSKTIQYSNPYNKAIGQILPGSTDSIGSQGYFPLMSNPKRYEITYNYQTPDEFKMFVKDLDHYLLSFEQAAVAEDIRAVNPPGGYWEARLNLTINENGYEIYDVLFDRLNSRIAFPSKVMNY